MKNARKSSQIDNIDAVAAVFGLSGWQLLMPSMIAEMENSKAVGTLYKNYVNASPEGRDHIRIVAEREAAFTVTREKT